MSKIQEKINLFVKLPSLQFFAQGDNNDLPVQRYEKQYKDLLPTVFEHTSYFTDAIAGRLEVLDGVKENATAFSLKTNDMPVVVGTYNTGANVAFETGTENSSRFGTLKEVIYANTDVPYLGTWAIHEGLDNFTVNAELQAAVADRLALQAEAQTELLDSTLAAYLATNAGDTQTLATVTNDTVLALFNTLSTYFVNIKAKGDKVAKVKGDLYNVIVDHPLSTTAKYGQSNIAENTVLKFKGFEIMAIPDEEMPDGVVALVYVKAIAKSFLGISTARTIQAENFDGVKLQGAGKYGHYVLNDNKKAIVKVTGTVVPGP